MRLDWVETQEWVSWHKKLDYYGKDLLKEGKRETDEGKCTIDWAWAWASTGGRINSQETSATPKTLYA